MPPSPTTSTSAAASSSSSTRTIAVGSNLKVVGIVLAITSGLLIGSSFVFKKKGLLRSQAGKTAGEGVAYLKSPLWWLGMSMMILGEICNFAAYAFVEAIVVTPLGALSVVVCAILSSIFLKEKLTFFGWLGCILCILGSIIIALNGPKEASIGQIVEFQKLFLFPGFLVYMSVLIGASMAIIFYFAPRYGRKSMLWYIAVCSMIGGISVSVTTGLGAAIVQTAFGDNQFKHWFMYFLLAFVVITLLTEVYYLNMALALFNTAMVTPTYYVIFTFCSMVTTVVLFQGLKASAAQILTVVMAFLIICLGITILQMSKVDPAKLTKLDRRSTILLQAARNATETMEEKSVLGVEDPDMGAIRGSFGAVGSIIRARSARKLSQSKGGPNARSRQLGATGPFDARSWISDGLSVPGTPPQQPVDLLAGMKRHQLFDPPVPSAPLSPTKSQSLTPSIPSAPDSARRPTIKFDNQEVVHSYHHPGTGDDSAVHERRKTGKLETEMPYPPQPISTDRLVETSPVEERRSNTVRPGDVTGPPTYDDYVPHSAPPTVSPRFAQNYGGRPDARDIFSKSQSSSSSSGNLLPLSSSSGSEEDASTGTHRERKEKRYPKGAGDDDREESVSLWHGQSLEDDRGDGTPTSGIRLVPSKPRNQL